MWGKKLGAVVPVSPPMKTPLTIRSSAQVEVEDVSAALTAAEYSSVRAESLQSFATSQSIIQWSLATYGLLFGAGLVAIGNDVSEALQDAVPWMAAIIYGLLLPGLICAASWSWIGEIRRMERAGAYLRGFEQQMRKVTSTGTASIAGPLNWESFLVQASVKGWAPYLGTAMLFFGGILTSEFFCGIWLSRIVATERWDAAWFQVAGFWAIVGSGTALVIFFLWESFRSGMAVVRLGRQYYDIASQELKKLPTDEL